MGRAQHPRRDPLAVRRPPARPQHRHRRRPQRRSLHHAGRGRGGGAHHPQFTHVVNGRFQGGYITRQYGRPADHVHAVQLEMCQYLYMREAPPWNYEEAQAAKVQPVVRAMVEAALAACRKLHG
ncbi:N-formylglutamate amidohydrolase [Ramlibacter montanisoli]|uniref:N-formylglutamate amidohydrolase n=1 Tax=Ramlibacter montanisoli TaxID=2732512 RepID=UPI00359F9096